jgi:hypothetical protein
LIAKEVIAKVTSKINDKTFQNDVLNESINELEALLAKK